MVWKFLIHVNPHVATWIDTSQSGYNQLVSLFSDYSQPIFFSEFGCNLVEPRLFTEVGAICNTSYKWSSNVKIQVK